VNMNYFGLTDIGKVRKQNQDFFLCSRIEKVDGLLLLVCDGMGGAKAGNIASELSCRVFSEYFSSNVEVNMSVPDIGAVMLAALDAANKAVYEMSQADYECRGMGTTMVAAYIKDADCVILNVGDSRAYMIENNTVRQITHDHSYVQRLIDAGELTLEEAKYHSNRNVITRAVGTMPTVRGDLYNPALTDGVRLIIATDGLTNLVEGEELMALTQDKNAREACEVLISTALDRGTSDNATVVVFDK